MNSLLNDAKVLLKKHFGYDDFRKGQAEIISHILNKQDSLGIMPTGAGKSICYQIPALLFDGITIVVSPLISLMKDQVDSLNQIGIPATFVNSSLSSLEHMQTLKNISYGLYKIVYVAPERLATDSFLSLLQSLNISMFAIDEAHCISRWGHDFRPSYREIANVILNLKSRPIVSAFTATATDSVKNDIVSALHLNNPFILTTGFDRKNLFFSIQSPDNKKKFVFDYIDNHPNNSGIIYCLTRKSVDDLYKDLSNMGVKVSRYHAGLSEKERTLNQDDFVYDRTDVMVATNAFGMGIDKSNIRYVIHYNMPRDLESYYQEAGRAGRDGDFSDCILLFSRSDIVTNKLLIEQSSSSENHPIEIKKLNDIVDYCNTDKCLRKYILEYFGEVPDFDECNNCSNCNSEIEVTDITTDSKKILSCIKRMHERFGLVLVADVLKGSNSAKIRSLGFDSLSTHGIMKDYSKDTIKDLISFLITEDYICSVGEQYPVLKLTKNANDVLFNNKSVFIKRKIEKIPEKMPTDKKVLGKSGSQNNDFALNNFDADLFEILRKLRLEISQNLRLPPFIIFTDTSLKQMSTFFPTTVDEFMNIDGVGDYKFEQYGSAFLNAIIDYVRLHDIKKPDTQFVKKNKNISKFKENDIVDKDVDNVESVRNVKDIEKNVEKDIKDVEIKPKEDTKILSYNMFTSGKSMKEIANIRGLTVNTIENHLLYCFENDMPINLDSCVHTEYKDLIFDAIDKVGFEKLKPIKEILPDDVSYFDIKYFLICYKKDSETDKQGLRKSF